MRLSKHSEWLINPLLFLALKNIKPLITLITFPRSYTYCTRGYSCTCIQLYGYCRLRTRPSASQITLSAPWRASAADQTFSVNRKYFIVSCICAQKQYVDFRSVILDLFRTGFALARLGRRASDWV